MLKNASLWLFYSESSINMNILNSTRQHKGHGSSDGVVE